MRIFIGSSSESYRMAEGIAAIIEECGFEPLLWKRCFPASSYTFESIVEACKSVDGALFVFAPDDIIRTPGRVSQESDGGDEYTTRDNVLVECGLFSGMLGRERVAICKWGATRVPSDLSGITFIDLNPRSIYTFKQKIGDWLRIVEQDREVKDRTVIIDEHFPDLEKLLNSSKQEILMSSFFISAFQTSGAFRSAVERGINIRLLLPDFWGHNWLATVTLLDGLSKSNPANNSFVDDKRAREKMKGSLLEFYRLYKSGKLPNTVQIRLIDCVLPTRMTIIDPDSNEGQMYVHINTYINRFAPRTTFRLIKEQSLFLSYINQFESLWKDAREVDFDEIERTFIP